MNRRHARWAEQLSDFDISIKYRAGTEACQPDALSRRPDYSPKDVIQTSKNRELNPENFRALLQPDHFLSVLTGADREYAPVSVKPSLLEQVFNGGRGGATKSLPTLAPEILDVVRFIQNKMC